MQISRTDSVCLFAMVVPPTFDKTRSKNNLPRKKNASTYMPDAVWAIDLHLMQLNLARRHYFRKL